MGVKCIYTWSIPLHSSLSDEQELIHNHLIYTLQASSVESLSSSSVYEHSLSCKDVVLPSHISWYRICQILKHTQPTISGSGGGISRDITEPYLRGGLGLQEFPEPSVNPRHTATNKVKLHPSTCYRYVSSEQPNESFYITPVCPNASELEGLDAKQDTRTVLTVTNKFLAKPQESNHEQEAAKKIALLKQPDIVRQTDNSMRGDVFRCDSNFDSVVNRMGKLSVARSFVVAGTSYLYKDFRVNIASTQHEGMDSLVVELEYLATGDGYTDPLLFTILLNTVIPQSRKVYFSECNTTFSPCYDYNPLDANIKSTMEELECEQDYAYLEKEQAEDTGVRVSVAHLAATRIYGVEPDCFHAEHTALQYVQLAQHY